MNQQTGTKDSLVISYLGLKSACTLELVNDGHDTRALQHYLGHRNILHTVRVKKLTSGRFSKFRNV